MSLNVAGNRSSYSLCAHRSPARVARSRSATPSQFRSNPAGHLASSTDAQHRRDSPRMPREPEFLAPSPGGVFEPPAPASGRLSLESRASVPARGCARTGGAKVRLDPGPETRASDLRIADLAPGRPAEAVGSHRREGDRAGSRRFSWRVGPGGRDRTARPARRNPLYLRSQAVGFRRGASTTSCGSRRIAWLQPWRGGGHRPGSTERPVPPAAKRSYLLADVARRRRMRLPLALGACRRRR